MSYCEILCNLVNGNKSLIVSLHQALILLLFNDKDNIKVADLQSLLSFPLFIIKKELVQICLKTKILLRQSKEKEIDDNEVISYNPNFTHKFYKIMINSLQIKETKVETQETIEKVFSERQFIIDAAIVRIMKARKTLNHSALLSECFAILKFSMNASDVKKRIERLIEQEYLRRDEADKTLYHYIT